MTSLEKKPNQNRTFLQLAKVALWSFAIGTVFGGGAGGYLGYNADRFNLPFLSRGSNNTQTVDINKGTQAGANNSGNVGTNTGVQTGANNTGNLGTSNVSGTPGVGNINASGNAKIEIRIDPQDPKFQNDKLPGFFPEQGFTAQPPQLNSFEGANALTRNLLLNGAPDFASQQEKNVAIRGRAYPWLFYVRGTNETQRMTFKLDPEQKGVLLQFGMADLEKGDTNVTYQVNILADGNRVWSGRVVYGTNQQILSVPLNIPNATALTIEYTTSIARAGNSQERYLFFTRAEQLFK